MSRGINLQLGKRAVERGTGAASNSKEDPLRPRTPLSRRRRRAGRQTAHRLVLSVGGAFVLLLGSWLPTLPSHGWVL